MPNTIFRSVITNMATKIRVGFVAVMLGIVCNPPTTAFAQEKPEAATLAQTGMFAGKTLVGTPGVFLVKSNRVNVRARAKKNGKRLARLNKGDLVFVLGMVKGTSWYAVRKDQTDLGYVYNSSLIPFFDDAPKETISGRASGKGGANCAYRIQFDEHRKIENSVMETADYWVDLQCTLGEQTFQVVGFLFMTLVPYNLTGKPVYQVNFEIVEVGGEYEEALRVTTLYDRRSKTLKLESVAPSKYATKRPIKALNTPIPSSILVGAIRIGFSAWSAQVWQELAAQ